MATTHLQPEAPPRDDGLEAVRILLLIQGGVALVATIEAAFWLLSAGPPTLAINVALSAVGAIAALVFAARIVRGGRTARRLVLGMELAILAISMIDVALAAVIGRGSIGLMPAVTRVVVPIAVIGLLGRRGAGR